MSDLEKNKDTRSDMAQELTDEIEALDFAKEIAEIERLRAIHADDDYERGLDRGFDKCLPILRRLHAALVVAEKERDELKRAKSWSENIDEDDVEAMQREMTVLTLSRDEALADLGKMREERDAAKNLTSRIFDGHHAESELESVLEDAGITFGAISHDYYDNSLELHGVPNDARLTEAQQKVIRDAGFSKVYVNHLDIWETHYTWDWLTEWKPVEGWRVQYPYKVERASQLLASQQALKEERAKAIELIENEMVAYEQRDSTYKLLAHICKKITQGEGGQT